MPSLPTIRLANTSLPPSALPLTAVFASATSGLAFLTLRALSLRSHPFKAYVIGRAASSAAFHAAVADLPSSTEIVYLEAELSLLAEAKRVGDVIAAKETRIDLLMLTTGYAPFNGRQNTPEGIETCHALALYSRLILTLTLLPLLRASPAGRVLTVGGGGIETACLLNVADLGLEAPGAFGPMSNQLHMATMMTLFLERLASMPTNKNIIFMHTTPGIVRTGNVYRGWKEGAWGPYVMDIVLRLFAYSLEEAAERHLYLVTSGAFGDGKEKTAKGEVGGGLFLVNRKGDAVRNERELGKLRKVAGEKVWEKVKQVVEPYVEEREFGLQE